MTAKKRCSGDELVSMVMDYVDELEGDCIFKEKEVLLGFAAEMTKRFGVSVGTHDMLILRMLQQLPLVGIHRAQGLAPHASLKIKEMLLCCMLSSSSSKDNVESVIQYAGNVLLRTLTQKELMRMKERLSCADNPSEQEARKTLLAYTKKHEPKLVPEFIGFFRKEDAFWSGIGSLI